LDARKKEEPAGDGEVYFSWDIHYASTIPDVSGANNSYFVKRFIEKRREPRHGIGFLGRIRF
jgi:hypothetical protein